MAFVDFNITVSVSETCVLKIHVSHIKITIHFQFNGDCVFKDFFFSFDRRAKVYQPV